MTTKEPRFIEASFPLKPVSLDTLYEKNVLHVVFVNHLASDKGTLASGADRGEETRQSAAQVTWLHPYGTFSSRKWRTGRHPRLVRFQSYILNLQGIGSSTAFETVGLFTRSAGHSCPLLN